MSPLPDTTHPAPADGYRDMPSDALAAFDPDGDASRRFLLNPHIFRLLGFVIIAARDPGPAGA